MNKIIKVSGVFLVLLAIFIGIKASAASSASENAINFSVIKNPIITGLNTSQSVITETNTPALKTTSQFLSPAVSLNQSTLSITPVVSALVLAEDVKPGIFGANFTGSYKDYFFPARLTVGNALIVNGGITVSQDLPAVLRFLPDRGPVLRAETNILKFIDGAKYYFDNNVGIKTTNPEATLHVNGTLRANYYIAYNGQYGLTQAYSLKANNGQNCVMNFTNGLLTNSTCPTVVNNSQSAK